MAEASGQSVRAPRRRGFTLIELLVVIAILALLVAMLVPSLARAMALARSAACRTHLGGLARANALYESDNEGGYVPAASDIFAGTAGNLHRWHGVRPDTDSPFEPVAGPLARYLGGGGQIKQCPAFTDFRTGSGAAAYEAGSGGYGYSDMYVGSTFWRDGFYYNSPGQLLGAQIEDVKNPTQTLMFADAATPVAFGGQEWYVEESFAYCVFMLDDKGAVIDARRQPSIHFRHLRTANVAWCDAHVSKRSDFHSVTSNSYGADPEAMHVGWFGPDDNSLFDLE
jgi:prepilin-type N-terminal cleavage/methylation domain-containing protein/prepilin-type processing-associated H-X9-DG protein